MKFAIITLFASASAIRVTNTEERCYSLTETNTFFNGLDTNKNGELSEKEFIHALLVSKDLPDTPGTKEY